MTEQLLTQRSSSHVSVGALTADVRNAFCTLKSNVRPHGRPHDRLLIPMRPRSQGSHLNGVAADVTTPGWITTGIVCGTSSCSTRVPVGSQRAALRSSCATHRAALSATSCATHRAALSASSLVFHSRSIPRNQFGNPSSSPCAATIEGASAYFLDTSPTRQLE